MAMTPAFQQFLAVFLGTLPLVGVIGWAALTQNQRLSRIESQLDALGRDMKELGVRTAGHETRISVLETRIEGPRVVVG
jgi:hypothetical protein